jgi:hypothetical protein
MTPKSVQSEKTTFQPTYRAMADDWAARLKDAEQEEDRKKFSP